MAQQTENAAIDRLAVFVGEWGMAAEFKDLPPADIGARVVFEWMPGRRFLIQRWEVPVPEDGVPWVTPVWFAQSDHRRFIWVSSPERMHSRNLRRARR